MMFIVLNAMFGKVGRCASEEVTVELLKMKCLPVLFYDLESCPLSKSQIKSLFDFAINSAFSQIFNTKSQDLIDNCRTVFNCQPVAESLSTRKKNVILLEEFLSLRPLRRLPAFCNSSLMYII